MLIDTDTREEALECDSVQATSRSYTKGVSAAFEVLSCALKYAPMRSVEQSKHPSEDAGQSGGSLTPHSRRVFVRRCIGMARPLQASWKRAEGMTWATSCGSG